MTSFQQKTKPGVMGKTEMKQRGKRVKHGVGTDHQPLFLSAPLTSPISAGHTRQSGKTSKVDD